ncbi:MULTISPECIES: NADP-dependent oxidoreductase [unclassified Spirosoma]|uniref:NADP-dependent oxidoreductase n=1 Tax=unclassified Spirosoma TaxID=2621999 RepID=UPI0009682D2B|nr:MULTISPECIES: NADP-dependent oxidoreductase [unclassified Spirosoma]MBN8822652.1 NADP-dependent oxidoreductase [Spirosoma sp.]OJW74141.1 MAG: oxidoreductase [Spirosoma sp. 48-14]
MKAIRLKAPGDTTQLEQIELEKPKISTGDVLIRIKAISINPIDVKTRAGHGLYGMIKDQNPLIIGWDISGEVVETQSELFTVGDQVFGMINFPGHGKAYAEYVSAPASQLALKPTTISHEEAAATTLTALTAWQALVKKAQVKVGQKVLIHAASGGVGHLAVQLAKHLGAYVTGTSSGANKDFVLSLGADTHIDYQNYDWDNTLDEFDFVLDTIGGDNLNRSIDATKKGGTIISISTSISDVAAEKAKQKGVNASFMLVQSNGDDMHQVASLLKSGAIHSTLFRTFPFVEMAAANRLVESGRTVGKIVVTV